MTSTTTDKIKIAIDRGGTFTDCIGTVGDKNHVVKLLSQDPANYKDAPQEGIRRLLAKWTGEETPRDKDIDTSKIESIRMGTTVATNALLERKGTRTALIITKGFKHLLVIGNQSRPRIFDLAINKPDVVYEEIVEVDERVTLESYSEDPDPKDIKVNEKEDPNLVNGTSGEIVRIIKKPESDSIRKDLQRILDKGIKSVAIVFMHSYTYSKHEEEVEQICHDLGFTHISRSSQLMPMIKVVSRGTSATADSYLSPVIKEYLAGFSKGFTDNLTKTSVQFMQSDGGLVDMSNFSGLKAILSGPAGGVVGYARTSYDNKKKIPVIGFDMGGTSTDVSRYAGRYEHVFETTTAGVTIQSAQLDISTVAAGGGSRLFWKNGLFIVGPESAGAHPGPTCYRKDGPLTVTDANLILGRLVPDSFPKIFGPNENEAIDIDATKEKFRSLASQVNKESEKEMSLDEIAFGFIKIADEAMTRPIRALTEARGYDTSNHRLATFGGAGGQHACSIAKILGISQVLIHRYSSILSAYGMALADVVHEIQEPSSEPFTSESKSKYEKKLRDLSNEGKKVLQEQGFDDDDIEFELYLNARYQGTDTALMVIKPERDWDFGSSFIEKHKSEFGFTLPEREIIIDDVRVRAIGKSKYKAEKTVDEQLSELEPKNVNTSNAHYEDVYFEGGRKKTPLYKLADIEIGTKLSGPAIILDETQTIVADPDSTVIILETHVVINLNKESDKEKTELETSRIDPILLSIFAHRFMAIAEQMGRALQKTSVSTNVKERLDYSCALFDSDGGLVANAPHLPVHLGSMSTAVRTQAKIWEGKLIEGDVLVANHPDTGGSHLPDITVITPSFNEGKIIFYVASRAHHADIGGILPGSMPPQSKEIYQEGASIKTFKLVSKGEFDEKGITKILYEDPAKYPGCSGTRCLKDNISDLKAQVAANHKGISLISGLISEYGYEVVNFYMIAIQKNAEECVRKLLRDVNEKFGNKPLEAEDHMDDGSVIRLKISIDSEKGEAEFDFNGTSPEYYGNLNAPESVTYSAIIYCLRCMITDEIPLNQGCLKPIHIKIPKGSLLSPSDGAAVVGGNVCTSQRVTDVVFRALDACAASQGDCNNLLFGIGGKDEKSGEQVKGWGYYETIAGGHGAGPEWDGESGVHTHMTNTRITDPEILERRYPVILREFTLRENSGGLGEHNGGEGVVRDIEFRISLSVSILSERRVFHPYGLHEGGDGACGMNLWIRLVDDGKGGKKERILNFGGRNNAIFGAGDRIIVCTPGGGAWGPKSKRALKQKSKILEARESYRAQGSISIASALQLSV